MPATPSRWLLACVGVVGAAAWALLAAGSNLHGPHANPAGIAGFGAAVLFWFIMMVAMMLPVLWPWLSLFGAMAPRAYPGRSPKRLLAQFGAGYFVVWLGYSVAAATLQSVLQQFGLLRLDLAVATAIGGGVLLAAGIFQLTPLKDACLSHCRNPLTFFLARWDGGPSGPFYMGARHGVFCLGCCWALMALAFAAGVMNLLWMAAITVMLVAEQRAPRSWRLRQVFGAGLVAWGATLLLSG